MTYWGFQYSMPIVGKRASQMPLGLVTVAALLPEAWELRLVDCNVERLRRRDLRWAEVVLVGGMLAQLGSIREVIARAQREGRPVVVGGPVTATLGGLEEADIVFQGEAEGRVHELIQALKQPTRHQQVLAPMPGAFPPLASSPVPRLDLLRLGRYVSAAIQYSRGCPFSCEFCDVIELFGRTPRVKSSEQVLAELDSLAGLGYRGTVFFVDDNFIGNRRSVRELLPKLADWQRRHGRPFDLYTEASLDLAADSKLVEAMVEAGFSAVFLGLESPSIEALRSAGKRQNLQVDMAEAVDSLTRAGLEVMGGFIVGFDADGPEVFEAQRQLIGASPIPMAMIGVLSAMPGTGLWKRLAGENRLRGRPTGDQFGRPNFKPAMDEATLLRGYAGLLAELYSPREYYKRAMTCIRSVGRRPTVTRNIRYDWLAITRAIVHLGLLGRRQLHFWRLVVASAVYAPHAMRQAVAFAIKGEHLIRYTRRHVLPRVQEALAELRSEGCLEQSGY